MAPFSAPGKAYIILPVKENSVVGHSRTELPRMHALREAKGWGGYADYGDK